MIDSQINEIANQTGNPTPTGPTAVGVIVAMFSAILLWLAYLRLDLKLGFMLATMIILTSAAVVGLLFVWGTRRLRVRAAARKQRAAQADQEAETQRKLEEARKAGIL